MGVPRPSLLIESTDSTNLIKCALTYRILCIDFILLQFVIKYEIDPNSEDKVGNTPAHLAAAEGHLDCLKVLVYHRKQPLEVVTCKNNNVSTMSMCL